MCIHEGGQATIIKANDMVEQCHVAVKVFFKSNMSYEEWQAIQFERSIMLMIEHPNIMPLKDYYEDDQNIYLVMDYMVNDLRNMLILLNGKGLTEIFARDVFYDILKAINHIHNNGIVHRDIKMENILVDINESNNSLIIQVSDFGMAASDIENDKMNQRAGTLVYMAPEMIQQQSCTSKIDCWALGIILFELITTQLPFNSQDIEELEEMICLKELDFEKIH